MKHHNDNHNREWRRWNAVIWIIAVLGTAILSSFIITAIVYAPNAHAHEAPAGWSYPISCCSTTDCREVSAEAIIEGPEGYTIRATGETIPMTDKKIKNSPDGVFHWCSRQGKPETATICLFVPPRGF